MTTAWQRRLFDEHLDRAVAALPEHVHHWLEEVPVIVEDEPTDRLLREMGMEPGEEDLYGLHTGVPLTERGVDMEAGLPDHIMLFRGPIIRLAQEHVPGTGRDAVAELDRQIRITLLHEMGHHFGLDEDDLESLGYA